MEIILAAQEVLKEFGELLVLAIYIYMLCKGLSRCRTGRSANPELSEDSQRQKPA